MIKIRRTKCPAFLKTSRNSNAFRDERVVKELWTMQNGKCCYCEAKIPNEGHGKAVEHLQPKAIFPRQRNVWKNLLLACPNCNGAKADQYPIIVMDDSGTLKVLFIRKGAKGRKGDTAIIDPTEKTTDPEDYIDFMTNIDQSEKLGLAFARQRDDGNIRGQTTIDVIGLSRDYYRSRYAKFIFSMLISLCTMLEADLDQNKRQVETCLARFRNWVSAKHEETAVARAFARHHRLDSKFGLVIPTGWD